MTSYMYLVPSVAPMGVVVTRSSDGLSMKISWSPLTLSQARGFMDYYAISYGPVGDSTRQLLKTTETYIVVSSLNATTSYLVTVGGHTAAGLGPAIPVTSSPLAGRCRHILTAVDMVYQNADRLAHSVWVWLL